MTAAAPSTTLHPSVDVQFDHLESHHSSSPLVLLTPHLHSERKLRSHHHHRRRTSPSSVSPTPSSSSSRSSGTAHYRVAPHHSSGHSPLLQSPPLCSTKSYGTASDHSNDDTGTHSEQSTIVATCSPLATTASAEPSANSTPPPHANSPLTAPRAQQETAADDSDAATRVNDLLAVRSHYTDRGAAASGGVSCPSFSKDTKAGYSRPAVMPSTVAAQGVSSPTKPGPAQLHASGGRPAPPGPLGYTSVSTNDNGSDGSNARGGELNSTAYSGLFSPSSAGPPPTFVEMILRRIRTTSLLQFLWVLMLVVMLMLGNACQVIFLNFWIHQFPTKNKAPGCPSSASSSPHNNSNDDPDRAEALESSYTTFIISAALFSAFFLILSFLYWLWRRPSLKFMREGAGWRLLLGIGAMDTLNSAMAIYAAAHTPEVLQALFVSLVPIYSAFFTKWLLKDPRNYGNIYVVVSFALIMAGVALASLYSYAATHHDHAADDDGSYGLHASGGSSRRSFVASHTPAFLFDFLASDTPAAAASRDRQIWCLIFFFSVPPTVLLNVWQTMYMIRYTENDEMTAYLQAHEGEAEESTRRASITRSGAVRTEEWTSGNVSDVNGRQTESAGRPHQQDINEAKGNEYKGSANDAAASACAVGAMTNTSTATAAAAAATTADSASTSSRSSGGLGGSGEVETSTEHQYRLHVPASDLLLNGEDTTVKLVMLAADTTIQALMAFCLMPMDALPWFGGSDSIQKVWENLDQGVDCVLHCPRNLRYCVLYSMGFVLVYIAAAYLNRYSVTLCSMVSQLSGPITALVLIAFPSLNMTGDAAPWYVSVFAVLLLSCGTVIYVYWDEMTGEEKAMGEMHLKWTMMEEQAQRHRLVDDGGESGPRSSSASVHDAEGVEEDAPHHRRSRTRRYRRRRQSSYVVVVDHDPDAPRSAHPADGSADDGMPRP